MHLKAKVFRICCPKNYRDQFKLLIEEKLVDIL